MACCCGTYHAPSHRVCHGCVNSPPSRVLLPWFPTESAHDARRNSYHYVCSHNTCHQRSLRCNSYRQSGLAIYFTCSDLDNYLVLVRHSICLWDWRETVICIPVCFLSSRHIENFCFCVSSRGVYLPPILRWISSFLIFNQFPEVTLHMLYSQLLLSHQSSNTYTKYSLNASSLVKRRIYFILLPLFRLLRLNLHLVLSSPVTFRSAGKKAK